MRRCRERLVLLPCGGMMPGHDSNAHFLRPKFAARAVLFDLDGTLLDTAPDIALAVDRTLIDLGLPAAGEARVGHWIGNGAAKLLERALLHAGGSSAINSERAMALFLLHYEQAFTVRSKPYDGVAQTLQWLAAQGLQLAVCTNKPSRFVQPLLLHYGLAQFFTASVGGDDLPQKKPDPAPLLHLAGILGLPAAECLMVGDSRNDIEAARAAGMPVVAVSYGYNHGADIRASAPDAVIDRMEQLLSLLVMASA